MKIKIIELERLILTSLRNKYTDEEAMHIAEVILFGQLSGKTSHGIIRLIVGNSSVLSQNPSGKPKIISKTRLSALIEGKGNPAMLLAQLAMHEGIKLANRNGISVVGTKGTYSTSGSLSYYLEKIGKENLVGVIMARSPLVVAPFNSIEPLFGTNPIGFVIPANPKPLLFDMGTSAISYGALLRADAIGEDLPENVAIDKQGNPTTNPKKAMEGALSAFDRSYKSSGLAMIVELLAGAMTGAGFIDIKKTNDWGNLFIIFSPSLLTDVEEFKNKMRQFIERVRNSKTKDGNKVRITGEKTIVTRDKALQSGEVEVDEELIKKVKQYIFSLTK